jgi:anti-sigma factor RsiW
MDRFDDVETRIVEEPSPPPRAPRRLGPAALALVAAAALTGSLAAGASALTSTAQAPTRAVEKTVQQHYGGRHHGLCHKGEGRREAASGL